MTRTAFTTFALSLAFCACAALCLLSISGARADTAISPGTGPGTGNVRIVVPAHDIARGETISDSDLTYAQVPGNALSPSTVTSFEALKGMEARRVLRAGESLRADDVRHPVVVSKGQTITMTFDAPGVQLTAMGRAMSEGGIGDTVTVQNPASFRMINGVVTAAGTVRATGPLSQAVASNIPRITR